MRLQDIIFISLFASLIIACSQKTKNESGKVEVKEVTLYDTSYDIVDDVDPPPPDLTSNFKTLQDWLLSICDDKKPKKSIANYEFGLFESRDDYTIFLIGINRYTKGDTSYTRIEFEPSNMYFQLPKGEYKNLNRGELLNQLITQLKDFTDTKKFKTSFFIEADKITLATNGQTIWSKPQ
jgi:hypothetical protein